MDSREKENTSLYRISPPPTSPDEVDLGVIAHKIKRGFQWVGNKLAYLFEMIVRRIALVALAVAVGMGLAYLRYVNTPPEYVSEMLLIPTEIRNDFCEDLIKKLNLAIQDGNYQTIARRMGIEESVAKSLSSISYAPIDDREIPLDSVLIGQPFLVRVATYDNTVFEGLQEGIHRYLENNEYFVTLKEIRRQRLESLILKLDKEIRQIDSLKTKVPIPQTSMNSNGIVLGQPDPVNMFREGINYFNKRLDAAAGLVMVNNFHIITGLSSRRKPDTPLLSYYLTFGGILGLLAGLIIGVILDKRKDKKKIHHEALEQVPA